MCIFRSLSSFSHHDVWIPRERNGIAFGHPLACQTLFEFRSDVFCTLHQWYMHQLMVNIDVLITRELSLIQEKPRVGSGLLLRLCIKLLFEVCMHFFPDALHLSSEIVQGLSHMLESLHEQATMLVRFSGHARDP